MRPRTAFGLLLPVLALGASCVLGGFETATTTGASASVSGSSSSGVSDAGSDAQGCTHALPPDPPSMPGGAGNTTFVVAVHTIDLGDGMKVPGYDLDDRCTCEGEGRTCVPHPPSQMLCDLPNGVDNATARIVREIQTAYPTFSSAFFSMKADGGDWSLLLRVSGWNGQPDDDAIEVDLYPVAGRPSAVGNPPKWDGTDPWPVPVSSLDDGKTITLAKYKDTHGYVRGNVLYASIPTTTFRMSGGLQTMRLDITGGVITGTIQKVPAGYRVSDGVIAGRWRLSDLFKDISSYRNEKGIPICTTDFVWGTAKGVICDAPDILADVGGATLPCDALSLGFGFTADPAQIAATPKPDPMDTNPCPPGADPKNETCAP